MKKWLLLILVLLVVAGGGYWYYIVKQQEAVQAAEQSKIEADRQQKSEFLRIVLDASPMMQNNLDYYEENLPYLSALSDESKIDELWNAVEKAEMKRLQYELDDVNELISRCDTNKFCQKSSLHDHIKALKRVVEINIKVTESWHSGDIAGGNALAITRAEFVEKMDFDDLEYFEDNIDAIDEQIFSAMLKLFENWYLQSGDTLVRTIRVCKEASPSVRDYAIYKLSCDPEILIKEAESLRSLSNQVSHVHGDLVFVNSFCDIEKKWKKSDYCLELTDKLRDSIMIGLENSVNDVDLAMASLGISIGDDDGLENETETQIGTDPNKTDTDGDGYSDSEEVFSGNDPLKPAQ